jgi:predicted anti-sigma-YlaC factor YlaD
METNDSISCPEVRRLLDSFCNDRIKSEQSSLVRRHVAQCEECRRAFLNMAASQFFAARGTTIEGCLDEDMPCMSTSEAAAPRASVS